MLIGDRKKLRNGNGFVLGVTGGGKGMDIKQELMQVYLNTKDDILVIDPQNEYQVIAEYLKETFIDFGAEAGHTVNPLSNIFWCAAMASASFSNTPLLNISNN